MTPVGGPRHREPHATLVGMFSGERALSARALTWCGWAVTPVGWELDDPDDLTDEAAHARTRQSTSATRRRSGLCLRVHIVLRGPGAALHLGDAPGGARPRRNAFADLTSAEAGEAARASEGVAVVNPNRSCLWQVDGLEGTRQTPEWR